MKRFIPLLVFAVVCIGLALSLLLSRPPGKNALVGKSFPVFETTGVDGGTLTDAALKDHVAVVNVFASWCAPCLEEHPQLIRFHQRFPDVVILGIGWMDTPERISALLKEHGSPYTHVGVDQTGALTAPLGITGVPETYVVDKDGIVRAKFAEPVTEEMLAKELQPLLQE